MPITVHELFESQNLFDYKKICWGESFEDTRAGVYIVSLSEDPKINNGLIELPLFDDNQFNLWINSKHPINPI